MRCYRINQIFNSVVLFLIVIAMSASSVSRSAGRRIYDPKPWSAKITHRSIPLIFVRNDGQAESDIRFLSRNSDYDLLLKKDGFRLTARPPAQRAGHHRPSPRKSHGSISMELQGANPLADPVGIDPEPARMNYFLGDDPLRWKTRVPAHEKVRYHGIYPGIDLVFYGQQQKVEFDYVVGPGADPDRIAMRYGGADSISITPEGDLRLGFGDHSITQKKPVLYQDAGALRRSIEGEYHLAPDRTVRFQIGEYDTRLPLIIDPVLHYSTFFGGTGNDSAESVAVDADGNIYVAGLTVSADLPVSQNAVQKQIAGDLDVFVLKLNPAGDRIIYCTYLGGTDDDFGRGIAIDGAGNAFVAGDTLSTNFPVKNAAQSNYGGGIADGFVSKLNPDGSVLEYSTYAGGSGEEYLFKVAIDSEGNGYLCGQTDSTNYPTVNALYPNYGGGFIDGFITKIDPSGTMFLYSTYLGGSNSDTVLGIGVDAEKNIFVTGGTNSPNFPVLNAYQATRSESYDVFVTKLNATGQNLAFSTYLGGTGTESGADLAVNSVGQVFVTGSTTSRDFPVEAPAQPVFGGGNFDAFVFKLGHLGNALLYSTYFGGDGMADRGDDEAFAIAVDSFDQAYIAGVTHSSSLPTTGSQKTGTTERDVFVAKLIPAGIPIGYSIYIGGAGPEISRDIAVDGNGNAYVVGITGSADYPTVNPLQMTIGGASDSFITRLEQEERGVMTSVSAASYAKTSISPESIAAAFGAGLADLTLPATGSPLPTSLAGTMMTLNHQPVPLFFISPGQINFLVPAGLGAGTGAITLYNDKAVIGGGIVQITTVAPGLFSADATGHGPAAAVALRVRADGSQSWEPVVRYDPPTKKFVTVPIDLGQPNDRVFLILFGTGVRFRSALSATQATIGGTNTDVLYCGSQPDFAGLDQINLLISPSLAGRGEVLVTLTADGREANPVAINLN